MNKVTLTAIILGIVTLGGIYFLIQKKDVKVTTKENDRSTQESFVASVPLAVKKVVETSPKDTLITNKNSMHMITIETNYGKIVFETYDKDAPKTVENFITLANKGFYADVIFHRVISGFMIQGGDPTGTGSGGPGYKFADELDPNTQSYKNGYKKGVVAMANAGPNTNGSQFFIMLTDYPLPNLYTIFGKVVSGQEVVDTIGKVPTGESDKPIEDVIIKKVTVTKTQ